jgi:GNAT superfamily N-acetyltransferase
MRKRVNLSLTDAVAADYEEVVALANLAYRGAQAGWATEAGTIEGQRLSLTRLQEDFAANPGAHLLLYRDAESVLRGTVWLAPVDDRTWYLGLLTVHPELQAQGLGAMILAAAESFARAHQVGRIKMTVLNVRSTLLAWYQRRGYALTGETQPFPYGDDRFGKPLREDLSFAVLDKIL